MDLSRRGSQVPPERLNALWAFFKTRLTRTRLRPFEMDQDLAPPADAGRQLLGLKVFADAFDALGNLWLRGVEALVGLAPKRPSTISPL